MSQKASFNTGSHHSKELFLVLFFLVLVYKPLMVVTPSVISSDQLYRFKLNKAHMSELAFCSDPIKHHKKAF